MATKCAINGRQWGAYDGRRQVGATGRIVQHDERREEQDAFAVDGRRASRLPSSDQPVDGRPQET